MTRRHDLRAWTRAAGGHRLKPRDHQLLLILGTYTDAETLLCWPGVKTLMRDCQCAKGTLYDSLKRLAAHGLISRHNHPQRASKLTRLHADAVVLDPDPTECVECIAAARGSDSSDPASPAPPIAPTWSEESDVAPSDDSDLGGPAVRTGGSEPSYSGGSDDSDPEVEVEVEVDPLEEGEIGTRARPGAADAAPDADPEWRWRADAQAFVARHREHLAGEEGEAIEAFLAVRRAGLTPSVLDLQAILDGGTVWFGEGVVAS